MGSPVIVATVVVPFRDAERTLERCLESLVRQQAPVDFEVLAIDNGSADGSRTVARRVAAAHPGRLRLLSQPRPGAYAARNLGIREARGRCLLFTDADCRAEAGWVAALVAALDDPRALVAGGEVLGDPEQTELLARYARLAGILSQRHALGHPRGPFLQTANMAARLAEVRAIGGFDEALGSGGDADLCWRLARSRPDAGVRLLGDAGVVHVHRRTVREMFAQFRRYGTSDVALAARHGEVRFDAAGRLAADTLRVLGLPLFLLAGLPQALLHRDALPLARPVLRVVQLAGRRAGRIAARRDPAACRPR